MEAAARAVVRLTEHHTEYEAGQPVERAPLLIELAESATAQDKRGSGSGGAGIPINLGVLALQDFIRGRLSRLRNYLNLPATKEVLEGTREAWAYAQDERAGARINDEAWLKIEAEFPDWVQRITEEVSPPTTTEMIAPCPHCGETRAFLRGDTVTAVVVKWYPEELDRAPIGKCRFCEAEWVGWGAMHYDLEVVDRTALAKLGIDVSLFKSQILLP